MISVAEPVIGEEERRNVSAVLESGRFLQGQFVEEFEEKWAALTDVEHAIAVSNGTTAIQLSIQALGLEPGDEVIVPSLTFGSTATAVVHAGCIPTFADIDPETYTIDVTSLDRHVTERTKAIVPVHLYGHPAEMDELLAFADAHDLSVIEDGAQAHGASYRGRPVGGIGDVGCFSFYATKNITTGEGGIVTTDDPDVAEQVRLMRSHGMSGRDRHVTLGYNYRMNELNAAIGTAQVDRLEEFNEIRAEITREYYDRLSDVEWLAIPSIREYVDHAYFWSPFEVRADRIGVTGKEVWKGLKDAGIETRHRYTEPLYKQPVFAEKRGFNSSFPWSLNDVEYDYDIALENVERIAGNVIGLPNHPNLTADELDRVVEHVTNYDPAA